MEKEIEKEKNIPEPDALMYKLGVFCAKFGEIFYILNSFLRQFRVDTTKLKLNFNFIVTSKFSWSITFPHFPDFDVFRMLCFISPCLVARFEMFIQKALK